MNTAGEAGEWRWVPDNGYWAVKGATRLGAFDSGVVAGQVVERLNALEARAARAEALAGLAKVEFTQMSIVYTLGETRVCYGQDYVVVPYEAGELINQATRDYQAQIGAVSAELAALKDGLRKLEWQHLYDEDDARICGYCGAGEDLGHETDCSMGALVAALTASESGALAGGDAPGSEGEKDETR